MKMEEKPSSNDFSKTSNSELKEETSNSTKQAHESSLNSQEISKPSTTFGSYFSIVDVMESRLHYPYLKIFDKNSLIYKLRKNSMEDFIFLNSNINRLFKCDVNPYVPPSIFRYMFEGEHEKKIESTFQMQCFNPISIEVQKNKNLPMSSHINEVTSRGKEQSADSDIISLRSEEGSNSSESTTAYLTSFTCEDTSDMEITTDASSNETLYFDDYVDDFEISSWGEDTQLLERSSVIEEIKEAFLGPDHSDSEVSNVRPLVPRASISSTILIKQRNENVPAGSLQRSSSLSNPIISSNRLFLGPSTSSGLVTNLPPWFRPSQLDRDDDSD